MTVNKSTESAASPTFYELNRTQQKILRTLEEQALTAKQVHSIFIKKFDKNTKLACIKTNLQKLEKLNKVKIADRNGKENIYAKIKEKTTFRTILDYAVVKRSKYPIDLIEPNDYNVNSMSQEEFQQLKESIRTTNGRYLRNNPIKIWWNETKQKYIIIDGEHRWRACKELGFETIPAEIEEDVDFNKAKELTVVLSKNRGQIDHFKLSKLLNEEYRDENGKPKCTQQELADRFGLSGKKEVSNILNIYPRLKIFFEKSLAMPDFSNRQLESLSRCKNDLLREKLIEQTIKKEWASKEIRKQATKFNKLSKFLEKEIMTPKERKCILDVFSGTSLFELNFEALWEKIFRFIIENGRKDVIIKYLRKFSKHSEFAKSYKKRYIERNNNIWSGWYNEYSSNTNEWNAAKLMIWDFFNEYYHEKVYCWRCKELITQITDFRSHHEPYEWDHLWFAFLDGDQKIYPLHDKCHEPGYSKDWNKNKEDLEAP